MNQVLSNTSSGAAPDLLEKANEELRVDFFRKLGYSSAEVKAAFRKLGLSTDTNSVLGELVRTRTTAADSVSSTDCDERSADFKDPLLPHSWTLGSCRVTPQMGDQNRDTELRPVVIDGSNVAMSHGNKEVFSCRGIQLAVNFFLDRGHNAVTVFVPTWRKEQPRPDAPLTDQHILLELEKQKIVVFTPSRRVGGKRVVCYDDRFIVKLAYESEGVIVSNDTYRDLQGERPEWKKCIEERLLMYSFVNDKFMPPDDPLGRHGPNLDNFLRKNPLPVEQKKQLCPYDKKCTYGMKCKFYHPERTNQSYLSLADELREKAQISTSKEEKSAKISPRHLQSDPAPAPSMFCCPPHTEIKRDQQVSACSSQVSENKLLYWEDLRKTQNRAPCCVTGTQSQKEWPGLHMTPNNYYANVSHEYLDSGLGSFESQYSDTSQSLSNSHVLRPQHAAVLAGLERSPVHSDTNTTSQSCRCCPASVPLTSHRHHHVNIDSKGQANYDPYRSHMFPPAVANRHSLPGAFHYSGGPHLQQSYWSDPFQGLPIHSSHSHNSSSSYEDHQYNSWVQSQSPPAFESKRLELRKNLQAIFNPHQVDTVMEMFPHLTNAEKLAAEILNLKTQRGIF